MYGFWVPDAMDDDELAGRGGPDDPMAWPKSDEEARWDAGMGKPALDCFLDPIIMAAVVAEVVFEGCG